MDHDTVMGTKGATKIVAKMGIGQDRAPNTIKLRNEYDRYIIDRQSDGLDFMVFGEWAKKFHPDMKILEQVRQRQ